MDENSITHADMEPFRDLFFLGAVGCSRRPPLATFVWTAPQACRKCPAGRHYVNVAVTVSLN